MGRFNKHVINSEQSGFTLIEILVAMAIFALIAVGSVTMLTAVSAQNDLSNERMQALQTMQRAMLIIERDFLQMVPRKTRVEGEVSDILVFGGVL
jgi:general secretion pathway protein J